MELSRLLGVVGALLLVGSLAVTSANAGPILSSDIITVPGKVTGSGNGTLDLRLFTYSGSEILNEAGTFDGDNGNGHLPQGAGEDIQAFAESYVTTGRKLKDYYNLNFAANSVTNIAIYLDLNETGGGEPYNTLAKLDVILNPTSLQGNPDPLGGDVTGDEQHAIAQVYTGGTKIAYLSPEPADNLPVNNQGAGFADYMILTGINPFALNDNDVVLFNVSMGTLNNGAEELFFSGTYAPTDVTTIPEPASLLLLGMGGIGALLARRRRQAA